MDSSNRTTVQIDPAVLKDFERLPGNKSGRQAISFSDEEKAILLEFWPRKNRVELARKMGYSANTLRRIYRELTEEK